MIQWERISGGLMSSATGEAKRLRLCGIFTAAPRGDGNWRLKLYSREFSFEWEFGSKARALAYAEALAVAWGLEEYVVGTPEPDPADRHQAIAYRDMRFGMGYGPAVAKTYVSA